MEKSLWEYYSRLEIKEIPHLTWNRNFIPIFTKARYWVSILSQANPVPIRLLYLCKSRFNIIFPYTSAYLYVRYVCLVSVHYLATKYILCNCSKFK